uniref:RING-type E3 ubiquitin transferase n=1 Tax=Leersia perrieri TaxID=77586 RepID=A0A0D9X8P5_9ORYZ
MSASSSPPPPPPVPAPADAAAPPPWFYCYECESTVSLPSPPTRRIVCPRCRGGFLEENPNHPPDEDEEQEEAGSPPPPPPPPPGFLSDSSSDEGGDLDLGMGPAATREYLSRLLHHHLYDEHMDVASAAAAAVSLLEQGGGGGGEGGENAPASAASIAALPTVEVSEPAAACAICKDDLPLASPARRLPCGHLYHSDCIVQWLEMRNSCPVCRSRLPAAAAAAACTQEAAAVAPSEQGPPPVRISIRLSSNRRRLRTNHEAAPQIAAASPTQLAQAVTGEGGGGPANSTETVSSEWPPLPESDAVMSEDREGQRFFD